MLVGMGIARLGRLIQFIPHPVTTGFTSGIAVVIATLQVKDLLGLDVRSMPDSYIEKLATLWNARGSMRVAEIGVAASTFALLVLIPRVIKRIPAPLIAIGIASAAAVLVHQIDPTFEVATIGT